MACAQRPSSGKQEMQTDGRAEGANVSIPVFVVGPGHSTTAAQQRQLVIHERTFKVVFEGQKLNGLGNFEKETLLSEQGAWTAHIWHE